MRLIIIVFVFVSHVLTSMAQVDGYVIDVNQNEMDIIVNIPFTVNSTFNEIQFQKRPKQLVNGKKQILNPNEVLEIGFYFGGRNYTYRSIPIRGKMQFKKLVLDGPVSIFEELQTPSNQPSISYIPLRSTMTNTRYLVCQEGGNAFYPTSWNFKKRLIKKLNPCPEFKAFIKSDNYDLDQILFVIEQYNSLCK